MTIIIKRLDALKVGQEKYTSLEPEDIEAGMKFEVIKVIGDYSLDGPRRKL